MPPRKNVCGLDGNGTSASSAAASVNTAFRSGGQASWTGDKGGRSGGSETETMDILHPGRKHVLVPTHTRFRRPPPAKPFNPRFESGRGGRRRGDSSILFPRSMFLI